MTYTLPALYSPHLLPTFDIYPHISPVILRPAVQGDGEIVDHPFVEVTESVHPALSAVNHHVGQ